MRLRPVVLALAAVLPTVALLACCVPGAPSVDGPPGDALPPSSIEGPGTPGDSESPDTPAEVSPAPDWTSLLAEVPDPATSTYVEYNEAIANALRRVYAADPCVAVLSGNLANLLTPYDPEYGTYTGYYHSWGHFDDPEARNRNSWDPLNAPTSVRVEFTRNAADSPDAGYSPAYKINAVAQRSHWDPSSNEQAAKVRDELYEAILRIWQASAGAYLPLGVDFWAGFSALQRLTLTGEFPAGRFLLPGEHGGGILLSTNVGNFGEGGCSVGLGLRALNPAGRREPEPGDWDSLVAELPEPGFVIMEWSNYEQGVLLALRRAWAHDPRVSVNWTSRRGLEGWWEPEFTWLHLPTPSDESGYLLETLTMRLTPAGEEGASDVGEQPLAISATVTEVIAWEPEYRAGTPVFEALVPARRVFLDGYLALGDDFWSDFAKLEFIPGMKAELSGAGGATVVVAVEDVSLRAGLISRRYTLIWGGGAGN